MTTVGKTPKGFTEPRSGSPRTGSRGRVREDDERLQPLPLRPRDRDQATLVHKTNRLVRGRGARDGYTIARTPRIRSREVDGRQERERVRERHELPGIFQTEGAHGGALELLAVRVTEVR